MATKRLPRYDVRNEGAGPYPVFYCDRCGRGFRGQPVVEPTILHDIEPQAARGLLRDVPLAGGALADNVSEDLRHAYGISALQLAAAWSRMSERFRACPVCGLIVCDGCYDAPSDRCAECAGQAAGGPIGQ